MESAIIRLSVDRNSLNRYLGNTSQTPLDRALKELMDSVFTSIPCYCERCGTAFQEYTGIKGSFSIETEPR